MLSEWTNLRGGARQGLLAGAEGFLGTVPGQGSLVSEEQMSESLSQQGASGQRG